MSAQSRQGTRDLIKKLKSIKAKDIMTKKVITTTEDTALADIAEIMVNTRISGLPVVTKKDKKIVGILTATDLFIIMDMIKSGDVVGDDMMAVSNPTVKFAMSTNVITITKTTTFEKIIAIMKYKNVCTLPVVENKRLIGVIGRRDVFKNFYAIVKELDL